MRPYLEVEVVKVKKKEKEWTPDCCPCCGAKRESEKPKGKWANGENLDKIKFPCFCSYICNGQRWKGEINKSWIPGEGTKYYLSSLNGQKECSMVNIVKLLKPLIESYDIHILKGKIILFEEE